MTVIPYKIPEKKAKQVSIFMTRAGGATVNLNNENFEEEDKDDEVTHGQFFGENIKRLIKAFKQSK